MQSTIASSKPTLKKDEKPVGTTTLGSTAVDSNRLRGTGVSRMAGVNPIPETKEDSSIDEDFDDDFEPASDDDKVTKEKILKQAEDKKAVREYEIQKQKGIKPTGDSRFEDDVILNEKDQKIEELWKRIRLFLNDDDGLGNKIEPRKGMQPARIRFMEACQRYADLKQPTILHFDSVLRAFNAAYLLPAPTDSEFKQLFKALEVYYNEEQQLISWNKILDALVNRETTCFRGIFAKIKPKVNQLAEKQAAMERAANEEKEAEKRAEEEAKVAELQQKRLEAARRNEQRTTKAKANPKDDIKRVEKEEALRLEKEKAEQARIAAIEKEIAKKEAADLSHRLNLIIGKFKDAGSIESIRNQFKMYDTSGDGKLDFKEFTKAMIKAGIRINPDEISNVYSMIDEDNSGTISLKEFFDIVSGDRKLDLVSMIAARRHKLGLDTGINESEINAQRKVSMQPTFMSGEIRSAGSVSGLSSLMKKSDDKEIEVPKLVNDDEHLTNYSDIKDGFLTKCFTFEDLLQLMGLSKPGNDAKVFLSDFNRAVVSLFGGAKFSNFQIRTVFLQHSIGNELGAERAFIPLRDFKDRFYPGRKWKADFADLPTFAQKVEKADKDNDDQSEVPSLMIDQIMEGKAIDDIIAEREAAERLQIAQEQEASRQKITTIKEDFETASMQSERIDNILSAKHSDPKAMKTNQTTEITLKQTKPSDKTTDRRINTDFYRQAEVKNKQQSFSDIKNFDKSVDTILQKLCFALLDELKTSVGTKALEPETFVDRYGKEFPGFITFNEFKEIYLAHVHYAESMGRNAAPPSENILRALFNTICADQRNKISRQNFGQLLRTKQPPTFLNRLEMKVKRGAGRLLGLLKDECQDADIPYGCNGFLPLPVFQTIMADYDLPMVASDKEDLKEKKVLKTDYNKTDIVEYKQIFGRLTTVQKIDFRDVAVHVIKVQTKWRQFLAKKELAKLRSESELKKIGETAKNLGGKKGQKSPTKEPQASKDTTAVKGAKPTKEELEKKKLKAAQDQRKNRKDQFNIENKIAQVVKPVRDPKAVERAQKEKAEISAFIKDKILETILTKAYCYGESLEVCREIQRKYENRPVTKYVYPLLMQFQFQTTGVSAKSLQSLGTLGQVMYLNSQNQLQQYDITTDKTLAPVSLGTRPPLKHYNIIDMVVDQRSGRIYTINSNWILEIWNIEQDASFPQKRIAVCSNEGGKDYISHYYEETFNDAKPRFLCLQDSNQQVLVVNTSCVDGSLVFIDPISFSVLRKIQLRYTDYEIPAKTRKSIKHLKEIFDEIKQKQGKDIVSIFQGIVGENQEVSIKNLVERLCQFDARQKREQLTETCKVLDEDGSGSITLDEFLNFFGSVDDDDEYQKQQEEQLLQDEMWPSWVVDDGKMVQVQTLLSKMFNQLEKSHGIQPEQAFGIYDMSDIGLCTEQEFKRVIRIFFGEAVKDEDYELISRLTLKSTDAKIQYRDFCKYLNKRFVRSFKLVAQSSQNEDGNEDNGGKHKTALEIELERPTSKEASLSYILRKAAELQIDLRREFLAHDSLELSVIPRVAFWGILINLPLGLNQEELQEVFDNDLNFDNYGNVDYVGILNSDIFVALERKRILEKAMKSTKATKVNVSTIDSSNEQTNDAQASDNRKVVVEDLIFIDDLEIIIYTTVKPKTSTVFITTMQKPQKTASQQLNESGVKVIDLANLDSNAFDQTISDSRAQLDDSRKKEQEAMNSSYQLLAKLKGHKNDYAPSICYIPQSNCLVSAEKHTRGNRMPVNQGSLPNAKDPSSNPNPKVANQGSSSYQQYSQRHLDGNMSCEILIWNLQRDMIELFSTNAPWNVPCHKKWVAHDSSIVDICYLPKSQLLVTTGMDQTIRFWDPVSTSYELTDPQNNPHAQMKPGYYKPLQQEQTKSNATFKEVKRIYTGNDMNCYVLRPLCINNIILNAQQPNVKSQIEWLVCLKNPKQTGINNEMVKKNRVGIVTGYGIERVKIEIPAKHHDDIVPPHVIKECEELIEQRRRKIVTAFQKQLPISIERIYSQTQLQKQYMDRIRALFMQAILNRKDEKFVNPVPLREVYNVILKLPARTKFESFLASSGCSDKLSVSETFFYLQKFMQIHPLRTTQIEFEKSIEEFYNKHQRQFLRGVKKWPKPSVQKLANYIRSYNIDIPFLQEPGKSVSKTVSVQFCTRERLQEYFEKINNSTAPFQFPDDDVELILNELDPYSTGAIQISNIQRMFKEEIELFKQVNLKKPQEIIEKIRSVAFPNKKIALQQSLAAADEVGDGYITKLQFIDAVLRAGVNIDRDNLELLFDVMSERFETQSTIPSDSQEQIELVAEVRHLHLPFFFSKLFTVSEFKDVSEVDQTLSQIKSALIYKGVDFGIIFAEGGDEQDNPASKGGAKGGKVTRKVKTDDNIDLMCHYTRFAQQIVKSEFCSRVAQLNAVSVTADKIMRLANYLCLNQKNQSVIYLNTWLNHLRRINTTFQTPNKAVLPMICSKLLSNESIFRSYVESIGLLKQKREEEKFVELADLRQVFKKFGISYINQGMLLQELTKGAAVHIQDLIARMKACVRTYYSEQGAEDDQIAEIRQVSSLADLRNTNYFERIQKKIKKSKSEIKISQLLKKLQEFDSGETGLIHAYKLINVLKYNLPNVFDENTLIGLQYELETLSYDHMVDYNEFVKLFLQESGALKKVNAVSEIKLDLKKSAYNLTEYEDLLSRISQHVQKQGIQLLPIFEIFCKKSGGFITYADLRKIIELIDFPISESQFDLLIMYSDENNQKTIHAYDLCEQIENSETVSPQFDIQKWIIASRELQGRHKLLEIVYDNLPRLKDSIQVLQKDNHVLTGFQFQEVVRKEIPELSEHDIDLLTVYSIRGSKRALQNGESSTAPINIRTDLIQFNYFERALNEVVNDMRKEQNEQRMKQQELLLNETLQEKLKREMKVIEEKKAQDDKLANPDAIKRQSFLINKITQIFREREVTFFDAFVTCYDPMQPNNKIPIKLFKELIAKLNLPLTVQDQRILRRIADPEGIGKVNLHNFCRKFETNDLRSLRLNKTLDKVATAFYIQNFNLRKAFSLFDVNGDGMISRKEFRDGIATLEIGIKYDEINDLMKLLSDDSEKISYDAFIAKMDVNIRQRRNTVSESVEDAVFEKITDCIMHSSESLFEALSVYEIQSEGKIQARDLPRAFKRLGLQSIESHLQMVLKAGGVRLQDERIDIVDFSNKFLEVIKARSRKLQMSKAHIMSKVYSVLRAANMSLFDFFVQLDSSANGKVSELELKTGIHEMGLTLSHQEFSTLWNALSKPEKSIKIQETQDKKTNKDTLRPQETEITYYELIEGFVKSGCVKFSQTSDRSEILIAKYRQQLKRLGMTVEKAFKAYDPKDVRFVFKNDFIDTSLALGFEFSQDELLKIFENFCKQGTTAEQTQSYTRFTFKQLQDSLLIQRDSSWIFQAYIKIHALVLQKGLTYKRLFLQWKEKGSKSAAGKLTAPEIATGLKKLKAGLTQDEIDKLVAQLRYDTKDQAISDKEFEETVINGAQKLEQEQSYERMILVDWISKFNAQMERNYIPIDSLFADFDSKQEGCLSVEDFALMNESSGVCMSKKDLLRIFNLIDRNRNGKIRLEEIKTIIQLSMAPKEDKDDNPMGTNEWETDTANLQGEALMTRLKINDLYEDLKNKIEAKNVTIEQILFTDLQYLPSSLAVITGIRQMFEKLQISISTADADYILKDVRKANSGKFECTYKDVIDYLTKKRINVAFLEKGFVDPLLAASVTALTRVREHYELTPEKLFRLLDTEQKGSVAKEQFVLSIQGMNLGLAVEDILELFNYMDDKNINRVSLTQFVNAINFISQKLGGSNQLDLSISKGKQASKGVTNLQQVFSVLKQICESIERRRLSIIQLNAAIDINKTGFVSRQEFVGILHNLADSVPLENLRIICSFFDDRNTGKINVFEVIRVVQEILNQQIGGGVYAFMQVQPIIQRIINQLSVDCDKFFDEVADKNQQWIESELKSNSTLNPTLKQIGLNKSIFLSTLSTYGVALSEKEKSLISRVFSLSKQQQERSNDQKQASYVSDNSFLDYVKIDSVFEGVQQQLYSQESQYTVEWERRVFKKIGDYLMQKNITIHQCFSMIDTDDSKTISITELQNAIIRFNLGLTDKQVKVFLKRLDPKNTFYITQQEFIQRFWSAYTYDDVFFEDEVEQDKGALNSVSMPHTEVMSSHNIVAANLKIKSQLDQKVTSYRMFKAVQKRMAETMEVQKAFLALDTNGFGFLTLKDLQINLSKHFNLSLKALEVRALFQEIDSDDNGIVKFGELEVFYRNDYKEKVKDLHNERQKIKAQNEIFDHLIKVLKQRGLTLQQVFDQIDDDKNNYIEVDEFHDMLERMGFTITQEQVFELMRQMDENFDGRISYAEMREHFIKLGFNEAELEGGTRDGSRVDLSKSSIVPVSDYKWRDKALELIIKTIKAKIPNAQYQDYFQSYDSDHDGHLTPAQFRQACMDFKEAQLKSTQIERILHIILEEKKLRPLISIERICKLLTNYKFVSINDGTPGSSPVLIDQDLFVYIVERYDGISRMMEFVGNLEDKSTYLQRHPSEINMRGLNMLANQKQVQRLIEKGKKLNELYQSTLVLLAGEINRLMKEEAVMCVLDPTKNIDTIVSDENVGVLNSVSLPTIENSQFDVDYSSLSILPNGAQRYSGVLMQTKEKIEILLYPSENLQYVSLDGKTYKRHLATELQIHRYLMGARFEEDNELQNPLAFNEEKLDIFANIGKFEKKIGLSVNEKEVYVVNKQINEDTWISVEDFVTKNGGILNIPLFYHTDAPLFIVRHWAQLMLKIIEKVHDVSVVLRCLNTKQLFISRDGQKVRLGHVRGCGKINNLGFIKTCPDIYLNLDDNDRDGGGNKSSTMSPSKAKGGGGQSSRKTNDGGQRMFSNKALDNPFIPPEALFQKFQDHTAAMDVWSFGMIMYCILFGRKPTSYYQTYKQWLLKAHQTDIDLGNLPFTPPSKSNFIYDPFSINFENPFENFDEDELADTNVSNRFELEALEASFKQKDGTMNFDNFMKCIEDLSYSGMFTKENSKKFNMPRIAVRNDQDDEKVPRFAGQEDKQHNIRVQFLKSMAKAQVLERKNELGLILDLISACLDIDPKKRPTIQGLLHSPIFKLDTQERTNAIRFSQNVILYRSPQSNVQMCITTPLRQICTETLKASFNVFDHTENILKLFARVEDSIQYFTLMPIDELNQVLTENEKRKGATAQMLKSHGKQSTQIRVSPNSPLAAQVIEDQVIDMLLFITFRYGKNFASWKAKQLQDIDTRIKMARVEEVQNNYGAQSSTAGGTHTQTNKSSVSSQIANRHEQVRQQMERLENQVLNRMTHLLRTMVYQMHSFSTPLAPFVAEIINYVVKFFVGEENTFGSEAVLQKTTPGGQQQLKKFLKEKSFFRRESELDANYKSDQADKLWHLEQKNKSFLDKSNYWCPELYRESLKIYRDAITESGLGQSCYPVICDYIASVSNNFEPTKIFSKQMSHLSMSYLIPMNRTSAYYNELIPISESIARLYNPDLEKAGKRCSLAMIRSVFQTGNSDKIKACLDMRVPKHLVHFVQDSDPEVRKECLYTFLELSKGLQDDDFEVIGKHAANLKKEFSKQGYTRTAFDLHKAISMASQQEVLDAQDKIDKMNAINKRGVQSGQRKQQQEIPISQTEAQCNYIKRTIALIEKNENEKYINFALDLPNLNFLASKRFLKEMAVCYESPVFVAPLVRLLKMSTELHNNKMIILEIFKNLVCGNERVLIALNSPACDTYMTLLKILMMNTKLANARQSAISSLSTGMRQTIQLQDKAIELFNYMFEQRRPTIIRDISCIGASSTLLKEQEMSIPSYINLPDIMAFFDDFAQNDVIKPNQIDVSKFVSYIKDLRCWIKHFFVQSTIPELTKIKAMQRSINLLIRVVKVVWRDYFKDMGQNDENEKPEVSAVRKIDYMLLIRTSLSFFDWLCINDRFVFFFNEESGRTNLAFIINLCNMILSQFRKPLASTTDSMSTAMPPMEDLTFNDRANKAVQDKRRYDIFPFTDIGAILQNIQYQIVRKNDPFLNTLLSQANFGFVFGEQLLLEYDFIRHCIDNSVESLVLMDSYVKKNEIRLNTFEFILRSSESTLKDQLIKSNFCERIFLDYIRDFREFNIQFSKIDLEFLAFRRSFPLRLEAISLINTALMLKNYAPQIYTEILMYSRRHLMIRQELAILQTNMVVKSKEATCLLLFAIILESNEADLIYVMVQEGAHRVIRTLMQEQPSLNKRFPILKEFINRF